jgi:hypothetical protein
MSPSQVVTASENGFISDSQKLRRVLAFREISGKPCIHFNLRLPNAEAFPTIGKNEPQVCGMIVNGSVTPINSVI